jgi:hypothetical protein
LAGNRGGFAPGWRNPAASLSGPGPPTPPGGPSPASQPGTRSATPPTPSTKSRSASARQRRTGTAAPRHRHAASSRTAMVGVAQLVRAPGCGPGGRGSSPLGRPRRVRLLVVLRTTAPWPAIQARGARPPMSLPYTCLCSVRMLGVPAARCAAADGATRRPGTPAANILPRNSVQPRSSWLISRPFHDHGGCPPAGGRKCSVIMVFHKARGDAGDDLARRSPPKETSLGAAPPRNPTHPAPDARSLDPRLPQFLQCRRLVRHWVMSSWTAGPPGVP